MAEAEWPPLVAAQAFVLEIDLSMGKGSWSWLGSFHEVSGLSVSADPETFREGGLNQYEHKRPGKMAWPNVTMKRGIVQDDMLFSWFSASNGFGYERTASEAESGEAVGWFPVQISVMTKAGRQLRSWALDRAFPVRWKGPDLALTSTDLAAEELEIAHHGFFSPTTH